MGNAAQGSLEAGTDCLLEQQMHQQPQSRAAWMPRGSDTDRARKYLDQANREVETLEAFVGRR